MDLIHFVSCWMPRGGLRSTSCRGPPAMAWKEFRSAAELDPEWQPRVVGGEGAAVMGAAAVITARIRGTFGSASPLVLSMRFSSRRRSHDRL